MTGTKKKVQISEENGLDPSQWHGPYEVTRVIGKVNYESEMPKRRRKRVIFHINMLKKWKTPEKDQSSDGRNITGS